MRPIQTFQVGLKAFVWHRQRLLIVQENNAASRWELPGGRIDEGELERPLTDVLRRELTEELGAAFACTIGGPVASWVRHSRDRALPVFLTGFHCADASGEIVLSDEHRAHHWLAAHEQEQFSFAPGYRDVIRAFLARFADH